LSKPPTTKQRRLNEVTAGDRRATFPAQLSRSQHKTTRLEAAEPAELVKRSAAENLVQSGMPGKSSGTSSRCHSKLRPIDPEFWTVQNELPDPLSVSKAELDAIEQYFGELLDTVLKPNPRAPPAATTAHQKGDRR